ncbi:hypothetical protein P9112_006809 [Eukaryota sp. TZLM1-RC]
MDSIFLREQIHVPEDLPSIITDWTKEVIRNQPKNIYHFSANYFAALANESLGEDKYTVEPLSITADQLNELIQRLPSIDVSQSLSLTKLQLLDSCRSVAIPPVLAENVFEILGPQSNSVSWPCFAVLIATFASDSATEALKLLYQSLSSYFQSNVPLPVLVTSTMAIAERDESLAKYVDSLVSFSGEDDWKSRTISVEEFTSKVGLSDVQ